MSQKKKKTLVRDIIYSFVFVTDGGGAHPHASIFMGEIKKKIFKYSGTRGYQSVQDVAQTFYVRLQIALHVQ